MRTVFGILGGLSALGLGIFGILTLSEYQSMLLRHPTASAVQITQIATQATVELNLLLVLILAVLTILEGFKIAAK